VKDLRIIGGDEVKPDTFDTEIINRNEKWIKRTREDIRADEKAIRIKKRHIEKLRKQNRELKGRE